MSLELQEKILDKSAKVSVMGLGYVGLPLAVEFAKKGFRTVGFEIDKSKVDSLRECKSYILDVKDGELLQVRDNFHPTTNIDDIKDVDVVIICVPTPLRKSRDPDLSFIVSAVHSVKKVLHPNMLIVLESTTYPGTTEELLAREVELAGYKIGEDIFVAFSPERVDPANKSYRTSDIPKVVGGITQRCTEIAASLYKEIVPSVYCVSSARAAEMVKLLENTFRSVNIALVNEMAMVCNRLNIDVWEVINAAATKPFGFMPFYPGPGIGGHCIPCDPLYLTWKARLHNIEPRLISLATEINHFMPQYVVQRLMDMLNERGLALSSVKISVLGVAYKKNVSDMRESPAIEIINMLMEKKASVSYYDPYVPSIRFYDFVMNSLSSLDELVSADCVIICTDHDCIDYDFLVQHSNLIFDTRGRLKSFLKKDNVVFL